MSAEERDARLLRCLWFPDLSIPTGELADWAVVLIELGKEPAVVAGTAVLETAVLLTPPRSDLAFVHQVLDELHVWLGSAKRTQDLRRLGDLWWSLTRNPPQSAQTPLGHAAVMASLLAGYDPEGWGNPPEDPDRLPMWMAEAASNVTAIVDVFSLVQQEGGKMHEETLVQSVRKAVAAWRETKANAVEGEQI
ncbi:MAG: hypothetical protein K2X38_03585 [Gemmataceae bacterium]|nr:hypothetical protein [Gemmataceae bacterium]